MSSQLIARKGHVAHLSRSKYGVRTDKAGKLKRTCDGILFDSQAECRRYGELRLLEKARRIDSLKRQPVFVLYVSNGQGEVSIGTYRADFSYMESGTSRQIIEDVKGHATPLYRWKKKHVEAQYGIVIREIHR